MLESAAAPQQREAAGVLPLINLTEGKDNYYVRAELPGVRGDELDIQVTANNLAISGERSLRKKKVPGTTAGNARPAHFPG